MSSFISKAACRGRRPSKFIGFNGFQRQSLISRLLKERTVARFIVAPSGYGKTSLAVDYAETVFAWIHTFFINCQSPCFIRDLDDDSISRSCYKTDESTRLVVFDAVPQLDAERAQRFSKEIDALLRKGCEVIVTCVPSSDVFGLLQGDQIRIGAADLLLDDDELEGALPYEDRATATPARVPASGRVPALAWAPDAFAATEFIKRSLSEPVPLDFVLVMASMYVLQKGAFSEISAFGPVNADVVVRMLEAYPHFDYDVAQGTFNAPSVPAEGVAQALKSRIGMLVEQSSFSTPDELVLAWAHVLLGDERRASRACDIVRTMCSLSARADWAAGHVLDIARVGCFFPGLQLARAAYQKAGDSNARTRTFIMFLEAICRLMLGDAKGAASLAKRSGRMGGKAPELKTFFLLIAARGGSEEQRARAEGAIDDTARQYEESSVRDAGPGEMLACCWRAMAAGFGDLAYEWGLIRKAGAPEYVLDIVASWLFEVLEAKLKEEGPLAMDIVSIDVDPAQRYVRERIDSLERVSDDFFVASATLAMERAHVCGMGYIGGPLSTPTLLDLRRTEMSLFHQRQQLDQQVEYDRAKREGWSNIPASPLGAHPQTVALSKAPRNVPTLELRMFGRFEVAIGGTVVESRLLHRQSVRTLLVMLAINQGRDLSREAVMNALWPTTTEDVARKNFYAVWSELKRSLMLPDGTCPYLVRHQYGCCLEDRHVKSDITRLSQICRELLFGKPDVQEWSDIYTELDNDFSNDLLPAEINNSLIVEARNDFRMKLVDALVSATQSMIDMGSPQRSIWFARMAIGHDKTREDAYVALMRAQIANDQRTAAIRTFLDCRRVLTEELGVDPSPETMSLYESLLD